MLIYYKYYRYIMHPIPSYLHIYYNSCINAHYLFWKLKNDIRTMNNNFSLYENSIYIPKINYYIIITFPANPLDYYNLKILSHCMISICSNIKDYYLQIDLKEYEFGFRRIDYESNEFEEVIKEIDLINKSNIQLKKYVTIKEVCPNFFM